jgi:hypothetical protein
MFIHSYVLINAPAYLAFHHTLIRLARRINLIDGPPQVIEEERPVARPQVIPARPRPIEAALRARRRTGRAPVLTIQAAQRAVGAAALGGKLWRGGGQVDGFGRRVTHTYSSE